ncbi:prephenate dehydrogenase dimerization domain-containing protein [Pseudonocardia broussonetiae]|uniref:Prephenate dehydrogenase n=1 Tax=Pseudonocardia broussonetiae TaxID=2736640 RepID=A0A6M6JH49_9PSEU|nr:prephenate dehydrogenase dimerization domain-containing protein [Pseudonocardia broussonetiae]QJY45721.1 prephenate dehydrogenase [Pseudonocardia broussonetiae]
MTHSFGNAVVIGSGAVGEMFAGLLAADGVRVRSFDRRTGTDANDPPTGEYGSALAGSGLVVLALPESVTRQALQHVLTTASRALVVDTTSVKMAIAPVWAGVVGRPPVLSVNPMFAPSLAPAGRPCLVVDPDGGPAGRRFVALLARWGLRVIEVRDVLEHDRLCAAVQAGVHAAVLALGAVLAASPLSVDDVWALAPPPCRVMLLLLARISNGAPEVYEDIQVRNTFAADSREGLAAALAHLNQELRLSGGMPTTLANIAAWLGERRDPLGNDCRRMFEDLAASTTPDAVGGTQPVQDRGAVPGEPDGQARPSSSDT